MSWDEGFCSADGDIYDDPTLPSGRVYKGQILPPFDLRRVPLRLELRGGRTVDSFALAIARAYDQRTVPSLSSEDGVPFGSFQAIEKFRPGIECFEGSW